MSDIKPEWVEAVKARFDQEGVGGLADWIYELVIDTVEPIIRADALSRFSITEFPNGKIQTLIADGTNWVTVSTANSMVDRARADEAERHHDGGDCECTSVYADGTWVHAQRLADLRAKAGAWFHGAYETARERHANDPDHRHYWEGYRDALDRAEQDVLALLALLDEEKP